MGDLATMETTDATPQIPSITELRGLCASGHWSGEVHAQVEGSQIKPTKSGGSFLEMKLSDGGDHLVLRVWGDSPHFALAQSLPAHSYIAVSGEWAVGGFGLEPRNWSLRPLNAQEQETLLDGPSELREKHARDAADIHQLVSEVADPRLRGLGEMFLQEFGDRFKRTAAAREYHHARRGGLVEHVAQMMRSAAALCTVYTSANRDLLLIGVLFHDSGKLWENCYSSEGFNMPYSEHGEMLGHITLGIELVNKLWRNLLESEAAADWATLGPPNENVRLHLLHLIASHHGEYQFGSPVLPKTPEAILLHHVDNIDAKWEMLTKAYATSPFLGKNIQERVRPLPTNVVVPLTKFAPTAEESPPA